MIRETQLNFELTACAARCRGNCISGTKASCLVLECCQRTTPVNCISGTKASCLVLECCQRTTPVQKSNGGYRHFQDRPARLH
jgi:hypothetical protein